MERGEFEQWSAREAARLRKLLEEQLLRAERMRADVEQILAATERISGMTGHLLEFTRGQAEGPKPVDVAAVDEAVTVELPADISARTASLPAFAADPPVALWQADAATLAFTVVSSSVEALLGYSASHWRGTPRFFAERIHPEDRAAVLALYGTAIERGGDASAEYRAITASGSVVWCRETIRVPSPTAKMAAESEPGQASFPPVRPGKAAIGHRGAITGVITDISRRKQLEEQLLRGERTLALHGMATRLTHDLNNPLMIIAGYAEEIRNGLPEDDPMRADVEQILAATERISGLTGRLLEFTRVQAEAPQPVDVGGVVAGIAEKIAAAVGEAVTVELQAGSSAWALAEPGQLEELILAIASAIREDKLAHSRLVITCTSELLSEHIPQATLRPGMYTCVAFHGDGPPLDQKARAAIFESFLAKEPEKASGQALARAYGIVRKWGGDIALSSDPSQGSTFTIYLPHYEPELRTSEGPGETGVQQSRELLPRPGAEVNRQTILIVDDEAGIRALVRKILRRERYVVLEAGSAEEALTVASKHAGRIDLLLTDVMLPGLTGFDLAEQMLAALPELKVIYISGYSGDESVRRGASPPDSRFLQKPFTLDVLVGLVRAALGS
jgi:two-component system cell cycle sensor histidine kinase/response regulator CckA